MKKIYSKPEIAFESFSLSTNLANNCDLDFALASKGVCAIPNANGIAGMGIFNLSAAGTECGVQGAGHEEYDGFCYHAPTEANNLFNS